MPTTATKTARTLVAAGTSNAAGGTTNGATWNLTTAFGGILTALLTNGATGPTVGGDFVVQVSTDGAAWKEFSRQTAPTGNNAATPFVVEIPPGVMYARPVFTGNTAQAVTVEAFGHELTSIG
jgi:hypothetical protein